MTSQTSEPITDREIVISRVFDASRARVWRAFTDPEQVVQWWGPEGFTNTIQEMDLRPGGIWLFVMHGPDGVDYDNKVEYIEVVEHERLVYDHGDPNGDDMFRATITFEERDGKTEVTMRALFTSAAERTRHVEEFGAIEGGRQTLARLAEYLKNTK